MVNRCIVNMHSKSHSFIFYYLGLSAYFLYKRNKSNELLDIASRNLSDFCKLNNKHGLARKYLEEVHEIESAEKEEK